MSLTPLRFLLLQTLVIVAAAFWIYAPALNGGWLWDDDRLIVQNLHLRSVEGLRQIWLSPASQADYYPLEQTALWIEWHLWRSNTLGYHTTTLLLHLLSALLVWRLFNKLNLKMAWLGGLIFAVHPVQVESVAWASELKNTLSLAPILLAMCAWIDYYRLGKREKYSYAVAFFSIALLCKITVVMFPLVILLFAWFERGRISVNDLKLSAPFFVLSLSLGLMIILSGLWDRLFGHLGSSYIPAGGLLARIDLAGWEISFYFLKCVLPIALMPVYPKWPIDSSLPLQYLPWLVLISTISCLWIKRRSWGRPALLGLGFFLLNLAPCPGFIPAPNMGYAWVMDHFLYLPLIGVIGLAVAAFEQIDSEIAPPLRPLSIGGVTVILIVLALQSHGYAMIYRSQETLWTYELQQNPDSDVAYNNLGFAYLQSGRVAPAATDFAAALRINPNYALAHNGLANALVLSNHPNEAMVHYQQALRIDSTYPEAHNGMANIFLHANRLDEARAQCEEALKENPQYVDAICNLGLILAQQGKIPEAIVKFKAAQQLNPTDGRIEEIIAELETKEP